MRKTTKRQVKLFKQLSRKAYRATKKSVSYKSESFYCGFLRQANRLLSKITR